MAILTDDADRLWCLATGRRSRRLIISRRVAPDSDLHATALRAAADLIDASERLRRAADLYALRLNAMKHPEEDR